MTVYKIIQEVLHYCSSIKVNLNIINELLVIGLSSLTCPFDWDGFSGGVHATHLSHTNGNVRYQL